MKRKQQRSKQVKNANATYQIERFAKKNSLVGMKPKCDDAANDISVLFPFSNI